MTLVVHEGANPIYREEQSEKQNTDNHSEVISGNLELKESMKSQEFLAHIYLCLKKNRPMKVPYYKNNNEKYFSILVYQKRYSWCIKKLDEVKLNFNFFLGCSICYEESFAGTEAR